MKKYLGAGFGAVMIMALSLSIMVGISPKALAAAHNIQTLTQILFGEYNAGGVSLSDGQTSAIQLDSAGRVIVTTPAPCPTDGFAHCPNQPYNYGTGSVYASTVEDSDQGFPTPIATATTTPLVAGVVGQNIYVDYAGSQSSSTNASGATFMYFFSSNGTCTGTNKNFLPAGSSSVPTTSGNVTMQYAGAVINNVASPTIVPAAKDKIGPAGYTLCYQTFGTIVGVEPVYGYSQH